MDILFFSFVTFSRRLFFIRHLFDIFVDISRVHQNVYFTIVGMSFLCRNNPISAKTFSNSYKINDLLNTAIVVIDRNYFK